MIKKAIITAAGFGSRFLPWTKTLPKEMLPIIDKPVIQYLVEECIEASIEEIIIVANPNYINIFKDYFFSKSVYIENYLKNRGSLDRLDKISSINYKNLKIIFQDENLPYGSGRPILSAKELLINEDAFAVLFGDDLVISNISATKQLVNFYQHLVNLNYKCDGIIAVQQVLESEISNYGAVEIDIDNRNISRVTKLIEKPKPTEAPSLLASYGRFICTPKIFDYLSSNLVGVNGELGLQDANSLFIQNGGNFYATQLEGEWVTTGDPVSYFKAYQKMISKTKHII